MLSGNIPAADAAMPHEALLNQSTRITLEVELLL
jgi:hypothetical protein